MQGGKTADSYKPTFRPSTQMLPRPSFLSWSPVPHNDGISVPRLKGWLGVKGTPDAFKHIFKQLLSILPPDLTTTVNEQECGVGTDIL